MTSYGADRDELTRVLGEHRLRVAVNNPAACTCGWEDGYVPKVRAAHRAHVAAAVLAAGWRRAEGGAGLSQAEREALLRAWPWPKEAATTASGFQDVIDCIESILAARLAGHAAEVERLTALWVNAEANQVEETERATAAETALADAAARALEEAAAMSIGCEHTHDVIVCQACREWSTALHDRAAAMRENRPAARSGAPCGDSGLQPGSYATGIPEGPQIGGTG